MNNENFSAENNTTPPMNAQTPSDTLVFNPEPRSVDAGDGVNWISQAWSLIKEKLGMWILINIVLFAIIIVISMIPFVNLLLTFIAPIFVGGIIAICENQRKTGQAELGLLFAGFQQKFGALFAVGAVNFAANLVGMILAFLVAGSALFNLAMQANQYGGASDAAILASSGSIMFATIIMAIAGLVGTALTWFAPALVMNHDFKVGAAISASLQAVKKNLLPGILFFIIMAILIIVSVIPFGLGLLISMPIMYATYYSSYRSLFFSEAKQSQTNSLIQ
ncbi:BPSS1780 family membrane protein [Providencia rustigianii]|uniref:BPSS1780 family membrane protein n=1 Tax=Providencia rustigianii TaxID=158850 RepID=UPI00224494C1|nr:BPSS1780 family membrane protein [Providencia rustigianii]